jgi:dienelactone hydrolase
MFRSKILIRIMLNVLIPLSSLIIGMPAMRAAGDIKFTVSIRGQQQELHYFASIIPTNGPAPRVLFAPGDGGWRGFAITMAESIASWGYDVYGLDTKRYLESFSGKTALKEADVMEDFRLLAQRLGGPKGQRITLLGWSEGAGLCLLAAAAPQNHSSFDGLVSVGISETSLLAWRWTDNLSTLTGKDPDEPKFRSADYLNKVAPLPISMIHSTHDDYVTVEAAKRMFSIAANPKQFDLVEAQNHRFDGNRGSFFDTLRSRLQWIRQDPK